MFACALLIIMDSTWNNMGSLNEMISGGDRISRRNCPTLSPQTFPHDLIYEINALK